ncbi:MAG: STAS domain-containing protein [Acidimicrobiia bacterium]
MLAGVGPELVLVTAASNILLWLAAEKWFMAGRGLAYGPRAALASVVREVLAPVLMVTALSGRSMKWRKGDLGDSWREREMTRDEAAARPVALPGAIAAATTTIGLPERFDSVSAAIFERNVTDHMVPGARIVVDGQAVTYMSAAGVRTLASVLHRAAEREVRLVFCRFSAAAVDCLVVSGFSDLFEIAESAEEALKRLDDSTESGGDERLHQPVGAG